MMKEMTYATTVDNLVISRMNVPIHLPKDIMMMTDSKEETKDKELKPLPLKLKKDKKRLMLMELANQKLAALIVILQNQTTMH